MSDLRGLVERYLSAYNARDLAAWGELFHEDAMIRADAGTMHGRQAAQAFAEGTMRAFPGVRAELERVVGESDTTIAVEYRLVNPDEERFGWRLAGTVCDVYDVRDGRIASCRSYYLADPADKTAAVPVPSRAEAARIAEEQAALRRVATLVARGVARRELFAAVNQEIAQLIGAEQTSMMRFEPDDTMTLVAAWSSHEVPFELGANRRLDDTLRAVRDRGHPLRFESAELPESGPFIEEARRIGIRSSVGVPIVVEGRVWGVAFAASTCPEPFPPDTEARIAAFSELVATAIANAQARGELRSLADEQEALRRVATLVAGGASPPEVFAAVTRQASRLFGGQPMRLHRYDEEGGAPVVALHGAPSSLDVTVPANADSVSWRILQTRRPARIDDYDDIEGPVADQARSVGLKAAVGAPIFVGGVLWGHLLAMSFDGPLPPRTEERLAQFTELVGTAVANADSREELTASRARLVAAADDSRRRIQRDLHDGAQQRLMHAILRLQLARAALGHGGPGTDLVEEALQQAEQANEDLRELVHGIMPSALAHGGLRAGVEALAAHVDLPVAMDVTPHRLPAAVETTAYFVVAEALTNAVKHAGATSVRVVAVDEPGALRVEVRDDGAGGADPARGTGLVGLADRVAASGGSIAVTSRPGEGTTLAVTLPA
ncbi:GAF domain-containing protein [Candidatus Solirubrobacter pratensis]|uniref:GAF domain-containing protein n=1 Tax=Candidatus Solirubrobacter pratensis TaxID=1298857 RepID=UPI0004076720|nr:GAF domain-containing protein [Candidatus Solirubrobacter pratensis]